MAIIQYPFRAVGYTPWRELDEPLDRLSRLLDDASLGRSNHGMWSPAVGVAETKDEIIVTVELAGLSEDDIQVELENNVLTISGDKSEERTEGDEERRYHVWERSYGSFRRSFSLPRSVTSDQVGATFDNGVLTVRLPKVAEAKGRKIEISKN